MYIKLKYEWAFMVAIIDWYLKDILSWSLSNTSHKHFCIEAHSHSSFAVRFFCIFCITRLRKIIRWNIIYYFS
jgi:hypothetical protein